MVSDTALREAIRGSGAGGVYALHLTCASHCCCKNCSTVRCPCWLRMSSVRMGMSGLSHRLLLLAEAEVRGVDDMVRVEWTVRSLEDVCESVRENTVKQQ